MYEFETHRGTFYLMKKEQCSNILPKFYLLGNCTSLIHSNIYTQILLFIYMF